MNNLSKYFIFDEKAPLLFNSGTFLILFTCFLLLFLLLKKQTQLRKIWTIAFSIFFYYKCSNFYFWILIVSTVIDYSLGFLIYNASHPLKKKFYLCLSLLSNLGLLAYFKYTNFFIDIVNDLGAEFNNIAIFLPIGISFYTFQTLSYSIDIYRGNLKPEKNFWDFAFFVSFFPQLVAGPIVRAIDFLPQLKNKLGLTKQDLGKAVFLIGNGLFKKAVISDYISSNFVDRIFENPGLYNGLENLLGVYGYSLQIYCDFSGYSDMAIGIALLLGFKLPDNFNYPYKSASITEFWRKWHISLSSWLKDYLYISLGGNRKGTIRTYINLTITMLLGGLWHGANWKFVLWGAMHGVMLVIEKIIHRFWNVKKSVFSKFIGVFITFHFVSFAWIFFRAASFDSAILVINQIMNNFDLFADYKTLEQYKNLLFMILLGFVLHFNFESIIKKYQNILSDSPLLIKAFYLAFISWLTIQISNADVIPFIYFQF